MSRIPSASDVANKPAKFLRLKEVMHEKELYLLDHRPHGQRGPPLEALYEPFSLFLCQAEVCQPSHATCMATNELIDLMSQVMEINVARRTVYPFFYYMINLARDTCHSF
jgi:hypothetical protein